MALEVSQQSQPEISVMSDMSTINAESALVTEPFEFSVAEITYRACRRTQGILEKLEEEPLPTASLPTRTPTTTGGKHVAGAKSAGSGETTPQAPARPATQPATMPAADGTGEETSLAFLGNQPVFESMRTEVQKNPALLLEFLHQMERSNPKLLLMISRNPQQFMSMLNETGGESGEGGGGAQGEKEFIDRLLDNLFLHVHELNSETSNRSQRELNSETSNRRQRERMEQIEHTLRQLLQITRQHEEMREEEGQRAQLQTYLQHEEMREEEGQRAQLQTYLQGITSSESGGLIQSLPGFVWEVAISLVGGLLFFGLRAAFGRIKF